MPKFRDTNNDITDKLDELDNEGTVISEANELDYPENHRSRDFNYNELSGNNHKKNTDNPERSKYISDSPGMGNPDLNSDKKPEGDIDDSGKHSFFSDIGANISTFVSNAGSVLGSLFSDFFNLFSEQDGSKGGKLEHKSEGSESKKGDSGLNDLNSEQEYENKFENKGGDNRSGPNNPEKTRLWRAVENEELADVTRYGDYNIHPNSTFKRFAFDEKSLDDFITANPGRTYTKTYIDIPKEKLELMYQHADTGGVRTAIGIDVYEHPEFYDWFEKVHIISDKTQLIVPNKLGDVSENSGSKEDLKNKPIDEYVSENSGSEKGLKTNEFKDISENSGSKEDLKNKPIDEYVSENSGSKESLETTKLEDTDNLGLSNEAIPLNSALIGRADKLAQAKTWIKPSQGWYDVVVHGTSSSFEVLHNGEWVKVDQRRLATFMKKTGYNGENVRLISCSTGGGISPIAQDLSNKLGVEVMAPTDTLWIHPNGKMTIGPTSLEHTGSWTKFSPGKISGKQFSVKQPENNELSRTNEDNTGRPESNGLERNSKNTENSGSKEGLKNKRIDEDVSENSEPKEGLENKSNPENNSENSGSKESLENKSNPENKHGTDNSGLYNLRSEGFEGNTDNSELNVETGGLPNNFKSLNFAKDGKVHDLRGTPRGQTIEHYMAKYFKKFYNDIRRLPKNFKTLDFVKGGETKVDWNVNKKRAEIIEGAIGISEKTFDVRGKSFETADRTYNYLRRYVNQLDKFTSYKLNGIEVKNLKEKTLNLRYVGGELSTEQIKGLLRLIKLGNDRHIKINIYKFP